MNETLKIDKNWVLFTRLISKLIVDKHVESYLTPC